MDTINDRIRFLVDKHYGGNASFAARSLDILQGTLKDILGVKKSKPSYDTIFKIVSNKELGINPGWLIMGVVNETKIYSESVIDLKEQILEKKVQVSDQRDFIEIMKNRIVKLDSQVAELKEELELAMANVKSARAS